MIMFEFIKDFEKNYKINPVKHENEHVIIIKFYETEQSNRTYDEKLSQTKRIIRERKLNPKYLVITKDEEEQFILKDFIVARNLYINSDLKKFLNLQQNNSEYIVLSNKNKPPFIEDNVFDTSSYNNYLKHKNFRKNINSKLGTIINHKFSVNQPKKITTNAILANVGYIIKGDEDSYLELSRNDYSFIRNFVDKMIREGNYKLKITESLPLYKEDIKEIISIGREILKLTNNKTKLNKFSKNKLGNQRNTIEGVWQLYFEKYLRMFFLKYKSFYTNVVFKQMDGYEKESIPDFLAVDLYNNIDVIEIKKHNTPLFRKDKNRDSVYPSHDLNKAVFQLNKYLDLTENLIKTEKITDPYTKALIENNKIYRPRGVLIISSKDNIGAKAISSKETLRFEKEIKKLKTAYSNIEIVLFDELIESLELYLNQIEISIEKNNIND